MQRKRKNSKRNWFKPGLTELVRSQNAIVPVLAGCKYADYTVAVYGPGTRQLWCTSEAYGNCWQECADTVSS